MEENGIRGGFGHRANNYLVCLKGRVVLSQQLFGLSEAKSCKDWWWGYHQDYGKEEERRSYAAGELPIIVLVDELERAIKKLMNKTIAPLLPQHIITNPVFNCQFSHQNGIAYSSKKQAGKAETGRCRYKNFCVSQCEER